MLALAPETRPTVKMRLGDIHCEPKYNFRREGVPEETVDTYFRRLTNGEVPPPIEVETKSHDIVDGNARYKMWKRSAEEIFRRHPSKTWRDFEIDVVLVEDAPDPDSERLLYLVEAVKRNRNHGEPPKRSDVYYLLKQLIREYPNDKERVRRAALDMNETNADFEAEWRKIYGLRQALLITGAEGKPQQPQTPRAAPGPAPAEVVRHATPPRELATIPEPPTTADKAQTAEPAKEAPKPPQEALGAQNQAAAEVQTRTPSPPQQAPPPPKNRYPFMASYADQVRMWIEGAAEFTPEQLQSLNRLRAVINDRVPPWQ